MIFLLVKTVKNHPTRFCRHTLVKRENATKGVVSTRERNATSTSTSFHQQDASKRRSRKVQKPGCLSHTNYDDYLQVHPGDALWWLWFFSRPQEHPILWQSELCSCALWPVLFVLHVCIPPKNGRIALVSGSVFPHLIVISYEPMLPFRLKARRQ